MDAGTKKPSTVLAVQQDASKAIELEKPDAGTLSGRLQGAERALVQATTVSDLKDVRDKTASFEEYLRRRRAARKDTNKCAALRLRAERGIGGCLSETVKPGSHTAKLPPEISRNESARFQRLFRIPENQFYAAIQAISADGDLTTAAVLQWAYGHRNGQKTSRHGRGHESRHDGGQDSRRRPKQVQQQAAVPAVMDDADYAFDLIALDITITVGGFTAAFPETEAMFKSVPKTALVTTISCVTRWEEGTTREHMPVGEEYEE